MDIARLENLFAGNACVPLNVPVLHPADAFLNTAGEAFRKSVFITQRADGEMLCLRPEFTIPVLAHHLRGTNGAARYSYRGTVFRQRPHVDDGRPQEFEQAGVESFAETDFAKADADMLLLALDAVRLYPEIDPIVSIGDPAFFEALVEPIGLPTIWCNRLLRAFGDDTLLERQLKRMVATDESASAHLDQELAPLVEADDLLGLIRLIEARMEDHGLLGTGARSPGDIATRLLEKASADVRVSQETAETCRAFLRLECSADLVSETLGAFASGHGVNFAAPFAEFQARMAQGLSEADVPIRFSARFGRRLDYYTGFVFEIHDRRRPGSGPVAGGGRYDRLSELLGGPSVPAVGFSLWLDRLAGGNGLAGDD
ncbi:MAG: ATP phosphoribosyltransferase regulatory subunit [Pseudomonadota bacterium]